MGITKPYPNIFRNRTEAVEKPFLELRKSKEGRSMHAAYKLLLNDLNQVFEYVEPDGTNFSTYSHRTYELLLRACTEVESNFKTILSKNNASLKPENILRYSDLEGPMKLSSYELKCRFIDFQNFKPFESFALSDRDARSPKWYKAYNNVKHSRAERFADASLENVIKAIGAVYVTIDAQFGFGYHASSNERPWIPTENEIFLIETLPTWSQEESYVDFDWDALKLSGDPFAFCPIPFRP